MAPFPQKGAFLMLEYSKNERFDLIYYLSSVFF